MCYVCAFSSAIPTEESESNACEVTDVGYSRPSWIFMFNLDYFKRDRLEIHNCYPR